LFEDVKDQNAIQLCPFFCACLLGHVSLTSVGVWSRRPVLVYQGGSFLVTGGAYGSAAWDLGDACADT